MMNMLNRLVSGALVAATFFSPVLIGQSRDKAADTVTRSVAALRNVVDSPAEASIPQALFDKCMCVGIFPSIGSGRGGVSGEGLISCRTERGEGPWSSPSMSKIVGLLSGPANSQGADLVLLVMDLDGLESKLDGGIDLAAHSEKGPLGTITNVEADQWSVTQIEVFRERRPMGLYRAGQMRDSLSSGLEQSAA
jgi:lipid-binding SYLF domain-containing protein